jgi:uncharacterized membrane protein YidH (DUF202 family)
MVYLILGALAFMAAFEIGGHTNSEASKNGVFGFVKQSTGGVLLLSLLAAGLTCYSIWRWIQAFSSLKKSEQSDKLKGLRYLLSGLIYMALAFTAAQMIFQNSSSSGDQNQHWSEEILKKPFGQWLLGIGALILAGIGFYQIWYGLSGKYKKHVKQQSVQSSFASVLLKSGKIGYAARGFVWLLISWMMIQAAFHANASEAGNTSKAFDFLESSSMGSYLLGALGLGLIAYGVFNFIRARFEKF